MARQNFPFFLLLIICACITQPDILAQQKTLLQIPAKGKQLKDFVPDGYRVFFSTKGSLSKDNRDDVVLVLKNTEEDKLPGTSTTVRYNRILLILLQTETGYQLAAQTDRLALCNICEFEANPLIGNSLKIEKGIFTIVQNGGNTQQWMATRKFRYQDGEFYLIGKADAMQSHWANQDPVGGTTDINLITGDRVVDETDDDGKTAHKHDKIKIATLIRLADIDLNAEEE